MFFRLKNLELHWDNIDEENENDIKLYKEASSILERGGKYLKSLKEYEGQKNGIKIALSAKQNSKECKEATRKVMEKLIPNAVLASDWMDFANEIATFLASKLIPSISTSISTN